MIGFLVRGRVRIKIRIRVRVRVGVMFNGGVYRWSNCRRSKCRTFFRSCERHCQTTAFSINIKLEKRVCLLSMG